MSAAAYTPREGTVAARMVDYLRSRPPGEWVVSAAMADATGADPQSVLPFLGAALKAGLVLRQKVPGTRLVAWRIATEADRAVPQQPADDDPDDDTSDLAGSAPTATPALSSIFALAAAGVDMPHTPVRPPKKAGGGGWSHGRVRQGRMSERSPA